MPKANYLSANDVAAKLNMSPKNFRKHLRNLEIEKREKRYAFTEKQAAAIVEKLTHQLEGEAAAE